MTRTPLRTRLSLDHILAYEEGDGFGSAEPYLWTVFFKIDGDTVVLGDDAFLHGTCTVVGTPGSHANLGDTDVDEGDDVLVPRAIGELLGTLRPIPLADGIQHQLPTVPDAGAVAGVVFVLMEEDQVSDEGAEAGHARLNSLVEEAINGFILPVGVVGTPEDAKTKLGVAKQDVSEDDIQALKDRAPGVIQSAIVDAQGTWDNLWSLLDGDDQLGVAVLTYHYEDLVNNYWDISERFQHVTNTTSGPVVTEDWRVLGEAQGVSADTYAYADLRRSEEYGTPAATGAVAATMVPFLGVRNLVYRDTNGHLHELWSDSRGQSGTTDLTDNATAPAAAGNPYSYVDTSAGMQMVVYRGHDANVHSLYWSTGGVGHDNLSGSIHAPTASGDPVGYFTPATNVHHVIYRTGDGHLHALWWSGAAAATDEDLTALVVPPAWPAPPAAGDPSAYLDSTRGVSVVSYRADDAHIHSLYWSDGPVGHDDLSGYVGTPNAAGDPVGYYLPGLDAHQVTYRGVDGHLYEIWWVGEAPASAWDLTVASGAPPASADPAACYVAATNSKHVVYLGPFGHLYEIRWTPGNTPTYVDLTLSALAPRATTDRPVVLDASSMPHVAYRGTDDQVHEIRWPAHQSGWRSCSTCQGLYYGPGVAASRCPGGGTHVAPNPFSLDYGLPFNLPSEPDHQTDWRWCSRCQGLFYGPGFAVSHCPAGGQHTAAAESGSFEYSLPHSQRGDANLQSDWRWCNKCQGLFAGGGGATSVCPAGGTHAAPTESGSADYAVPCWAHWGGQWNQLAG